MSLARKILVVDDEAAIRKFLKVSLEAQGFKVEEAVNGNEGITQAIAVRPDLIILDLGLPDMEGFEVLSRLREWSKVPVIVLTVRDAEEDKVRALDGGADDYLTKPFSVPELLARIRVAERHRLPASESPLFQSGDLEVDLSARSVKVGTREVRLTATEWEILRLLVEHAGKAVTHRQILKQVWGPNAVEHTQYLRVYVGHLRRKLERGTDQAFIRTEPGVGYRLLLLGTD
ncbi:MAG TPA: response regulator [bacterium]|nr:response regulator [bacterium]